MSDRTIGYSVIIFLVIFLIIPVAYLSNKAFKPVYHRTIVFENVNTLSFLHIEDPVRVRGIDVGIVQSIFWKDNKTYVVIETSKKIDIHKGYRINAEDKGLMGDRYVSINPGEENEPLLDTKELLSGIFLIGPTEAIAQVGKMKTLIDSVSTLIALLKYGTASNKPLSTRFNDFIYQLDSITVSLTEILMKTNLIITKNADTISAFLLNATTATQEMAEAIPKRVVAMKTIIEKTEDIITKTDSLLVLSNNVTERMKDAESVALLEKFKKLKEQLHLLRISVQELQNRGLALPIRIR
jgi:phospholipid/cholesterol/gamma-HCH transport system substrate-binding protein